MCDTCGCSQPNSVLITNLQTDRHTHLPIHSHPGHYHHHEHEGEHHQHQHEQSDSHQAKIITLENNLRARNDHIAAQNRLWFNQRGIIALNVMSSPGAGKTTLLERTIRELGKNEAISVIEGDQATLRDAERIRDAGARVVQVNTGSGCHLDAAMISAALNQLQPARDSTVIIENVGNLVCPALFDLGDEASVVVASVAEGDDKPAKYPYMFRSADVILLNKMDLLPYVTFNVDEFGRRARELNPDVILFQVSASRGTGLQDWYQWLRTTKTKTVAK